MKHKTTVSFQQFSERKQESIVNSIVFQMEMAIFGTGNVADKAREYLIKRNIYSPRFFIDMKPQDILLTLNEHLRTIVEYQLENFNVTMDIHVSDNYDENGEEIINSDLPFL